MIDNKTMMVGFGLVIGMMFVTTLVITTPMIACKRKRRHRYDNKRHTEDVPTEETNIQNNSYINETLIQNDEHPDYTGSGTIHGDFTKWLHAPSHPTPHPHLHPPHQLYYNAIHPNFPQNRYYNQQHVGIRPPPRGNIRVPLTATFQQMTLAPTNAPPVVINPIPPHPSNNNTILDDTHTHYSHFTVS